MKNSSPKEKTRDFQNTEGVVPPHASLLAELMDFPPPGGHPPPCPPCSACSRSGNSISRSRSRSHQPPAAGAHSQVQSLSSKRETSVWVMCNEAVRQDKVQGRVIIASGSARRTASCAGEEPFKPNHCRLPPGIFLSLLFLSFVFFTIRILL